MKYIALLRGINVGGHHKVDMKMLKSLLESLGYTHVTTYLNSGNALFESDDQQEQIQSLVPNALLKEFGFEIPTLIKTQLEIKEIAAAIPREWQNNNEQKTDIAYLFPEIDTETTVEEMPINRAYIEVIYVKGAIIWHVLKNDYHSSHLNKLVGSKLYKLMTVRNVNTARFLADSDTLSPHTSK